MNTIEYRFYHDAKKNKEVAFKKEAKVSLDGLIEISYGDFIKSGEMRSRGISPEFSKGILKSNVTKTKAVKWWQSSNGDSAPMDGLLADLKRNRDFILNNSVFNIGSNYVFDTSAKTEAGLTAISNLDDEGKSATWRGPNGNFVIDREIAKKALNYINSFKVKTHNEYAIFKSKLLDEGVILDWRNWRVETKIDEINSLK